MTFGERILYSGLGVAAFIVTGGALGIRDAQAQPEVITVMDRDITLPKEVKLQGWTYSSRKDCLDEHLEDAEEACQKMRKYVLRSGAALGSVVEDTGEIWMVTGHKDTFGFVNETLESDPS